MRFRPSSDPKYRQVLYGSHNVRIIESINFFCPLGCDDPHACTQLVFSMTRTTIKLNISLSYDWKSGLPGRSEEIQQGYLLIDPRPKSNEPINLPL
ncbi:hypothetical protein E4T56_gene6028 [Termitomyces sp. T112]|nr:hypothetical protein E4T56_gene6028 [Termitomyces sp. T112]